MQTRTDKRDPQFHRIAHDASLGLVLAALHVDKTIGGDDLTDTLTGSGRALAWLESHGYVQIARYASTRPRQIAAVTPRGAAVLRKPVEGGETLGGHLSRLLKRSNPPLRTLPSVLAWAFYGAER